MAAAGSLRSPLRTATYRTLIGLLAATGMRVGEAIGLDCGDADLDSRHPDHPQRQERQVPAGPAARHRRQARSRDYLRDRDRLCPAPARSQALLISPPGSRLLYCNVHATWKKLAAAAGLRPRSGNCRPRIHDLRHSFAVRTMLDAYAAGHGRAGGARRPVHLPRARRTRRPRTGT